jgi:hypothetical protein
MYFCSVIKTILTKKLRIMKLIHLMLSVLLFIAFTANVNAQTRELSKDEKKELENEVKESLKNLEGWLVKPGALSLQAQQRRSSQVQLFEDDKWLVGSASSVGSVYDAARLQAMTLAKSEVAGQMETQISELIDAKVANKELGQGTAESVTEIAMKSKAITVDKKVKRPRILMECYKNLPNGNVEVLIRLAIDKNTINDLAEEIVDDAIKQAQE